MLRMDGVDHDILVPVNHKGRAGDIVEVTEFALQLRLDIPEALIELCPQFGEALLAVHDLHRRPHPLRPLADVGHLVEHLHVLNIDCSFVKLG